MSSIVGSTFLIIYFKHFDFIECFNLNSNPKCLFERFSIGDFLVDCLMSIGIWFIGL